MVSLVEMHWHGVTVPYFNALTSGAILPRATMLTHLINLKKVRLCVESILLTKCEFDFVFHKKKEKIERKKVY